MPSKMAQYELLERIGKGGMAEIFRASQTAGSGFEKIVAIKRILPHLSQDQRFIGLLIAEAKILSELHHRNIVQIYDVGLGDDSQYFLVMEFVDGIDLLKMYDDFTGSRRLPVEVALHICSELCEALEHAHIAKDDQGIPCGLDHRDVSPSNVLLSKHGEVKLTDFGIAKRVDEVTGHGAVRGKFAYISPEQAVNKHVDARSDVFSVGILLYELVCGRRLYSGYPDFDALREVRAARVNPSAREVRRVASPLADIIMRALSKRPEDRYQSAGDFGSALRGYRYSLETEIADPRAAIAALVVQQAKVETTTPKDALPDYSDDFAEDVGGTVVQINTAEEFFSTDLSGLHQLVTAYPEPRFEDMSDERSIAQRLADVDDAEEPTRLHQRIPVPPPSASAPASSASASAPGPSVPPRSEQALASAPISLPVSPPIQQVPAPLPRPNSRVSVARPGVPASVAPAALAPTSRAPSHLTPPAGAAQLQAFSAPVLPGQSPVISSGSTMPGRPAAQPQYGFRTSSGIESGGRAYARRRKLRMYWIGGGFVLLVLVIAVAMLGSGDSPTESAESSQVDAGVPDTEISDASVESIDAAPVKRVKPKRKPRRRPNKNRKKRRNNNR